jgi:hypothetical protein
MSYYCDQCTTLVCHACALGMLVFLSLLLAYFIADHGAHTVRGAMEQVQKLRENLLDCMKTVDDLEFSMLN